MDWNSLTDDMQVALAGEAMRRVADTIAEQAESLANEMENGGLLDRGGPDALRLLAAVIRVTRAPDDMLSQSSMAAGHA